MSRNTTESTPPLTATIYLPDSKLISIKNIILYHLCNRYKKCYILNLIAMAA